MQSSESYCPNFVFTMADPSDISVAVDPIFQFDGATLTMIDPYDLLKAGIYNLRAYARYDGTAGGNTAHYDQYATIDL